MERTVSINDLERTGRNFYKFEGKAFRLFAQGITPNGCWLIAPVMIELDDIDVATGNDVYGDTILEFDGVTGTVPASYEYIKGNPNEIHRTNDPHDIDDPAPM